MSLRRVTAPIVSPSIFRSPALAAEEPHAADPLLVAARDWFHGAAFPARPSVLYARAAGNGAPHAVLAHLRALPSRDYVDAAAALATYPGGLADRLVGEAGRRALASLPFPGEPSVLYARAASADAPAELLVLLRELPSRAYADAEDVLATVARRRARR